MRQNIYLILFCCLITQIHGLCHVYYDESCLQDCNCEAHKNGTETCDQCMMPCTKEKDIECHNGKCTVRGCVCHGCWRGESCSEYDNLFTPIFSNTLYTKRVFPYSRGVLKGIAAFDRDRAECTFKKSANCPCSKIKYGIIKGENSERFQMNPDTGEIAYAVDDIGYETEFKATIVARNIDENGNIIKSNRFTGFASIRIVVTSDIEEKEIQLREILPYPNIYNWPTQEQEEETDMAAIDDDDERSKVKPDHPLSADDWVWLNKPEGPAERHARMKRAVTITDFEVLLVLDGTSDGTMSPFDQFKYMAVITIPAGTSGLKLELNTTVTASQAVFKLTAISVTETGSNLNVGSTTITEVSSFANSDIDAVVIDFGSVENTGVDMATYAPSQITVNFTAEVIDNSEVVNGNQYHINATLVHDAGSVVDIDTFTTGAETTTELPTTMMNTSEPPPPTYTVAFTIVELHTTDSITEVTPSQEVHLQAVITVPVGVTNITLTLTSGMDGTAIYHFCTLGGVSYGANLAPSVGYITEKISTNMNYETDQSNIYLGDITNSGTDILTSYEPSQIRVNFTGIMLNNPNLANGDSCGITASVKQAGIESNSSSWSLPANLQSLDSGNAPDILISGPTSMAPGQVAVWTVTVVLHDGYNPLSLDLYGSGSNPVDLCNTGYISAGSNFRCYDSNIIKIIPSVSGPSGFVYTLGELLNSDYLYGLVTDQANNSVVVKVMGSVPYAASVGSDYTFDVDSYLNGVISTTLTHTVNIVSSSYTTTVLPTVDVYKFLSTTTNIAKGSSVVVMVDFYIEPESADSYSVEVTTTTGDSTICGFNILSQGSNLPCQDLKQSGGATVYTTTDNNVTFSSVSHDFGMITNAGQSVNIVDDANKVSLEVAVKVPLTSTASSITVTANVVSANLGTATSSVTLTVVSAIITAETDTTVMLVSVPPEPLPVIRNIADYVTWKVQLVMPVTSDRYTLTATAPISASEAHLTVISARYTYRGKDLSCRDDIDILSEAKSSGIPNQQLTTITLDLGFVSYLGFDNATNENTVEVEFTFKVTDHPAHVGTTVQTLNFDLTSEGGAVASTTGDVTVDLLGSEVADMVLDTWCDDTFTNKRIAGDSVTVYGEAYLTNTSTAHAADVKFTYLLPSYISYVTVVSYNHVQPTVTVEQKGVILTFPVITFEDYVNFTFTVQLDPSGYFDPGRFDIHTVIPVDVTYMALQKSGRTDTAVHYFPEPFILEVIFDVPNAFVAVTPLLQACQFTASSEDDTDVASTAVSTSSLGWRPKVRGSPFCGQEYLQLNLGNLWQIVGFAILSHGGANTDYVKTFTVQYSNTGQEWKSVINNVTNTEKIFSVSFGGGKQVNDYVNVTLLEHEYINSRYIRIIPKTTNVNNCVPALRLEVYGIKKTNDFTGCGMMSPGPLTVHDRTLLVEPLHGIMYVCMMTDIDDQIMCSRTEDLGGTWEALDDYVANVIGVVSTVNSTTVLGVSADGMSYSCSYDGGFAWDLCVGEEVTSIQTAPGYVSFIPIPMTDISGMSYNALKSTYGFVYGSTDITGDITGVNVDTGPVTAVAWWGTADWSTEI